MFQVRLIGRVLAASMAVAVIGGVSGEAAAQSPGTESAGVYLCPPCGCDLDGKPFDAAGACPGCAMALVFHERAPQQTTEVEILGAGDGRRRNVAILVFPGVQIIDFAAPYEVFGQAGFRVYTVAEKTEPLTTAMNLTIVPEHTLQEAPAPDIVVVPGGGVGSAENSDAVLDWLRQVERQSEAVLTVCNGAFILAHTGLLDGKRATTFYGLISALQDAAPNVEVIANQRYVDNGKIVTTAGLSSGIDGSLHVVGELLGRSRAQRVALNMEYNWLDDVRYARAAFADLMLQQLSIVSGRHYPLLDATGTRWFLLDTRGDANHWQWQWLVESAGSDAQLLQAWEKKLSEDGGWSKITDGSQSAAAASNWSFDDTRGNPWSARVRVRRATPNDRDGAEQGAGEWVVELSVDRTGA